MAGKIVSVGFIFGNFPLPYSSPNAGEGREGKAANIAVP